MSFKYLVFTLILICGKIQVFGQCGYKLWLDYKKLEDNVIATDYNFINSVHLLNDKNDEVLNTTKNVLTEHLSTLLGKPITTENKQKAGQIT